MSGTDVTLTDLLEQTIVKALQAMGGPVIGKVDVYDAVNGRVSITPLVPLLVDGEIVPSVKLPAVPVEWPESGSHSIKFPIPAGSFMELAPLGHDHSQWLTSGAENIPPTDDRRFSLADLVAKPLAPSPAAAPPDPLSYDAAWGVLFGQWKVGSNAPVKPVALNADNCPAVTLMRTWMSQVETFINGLVPLTVNPLSTTFAPNAIASITATAAKLKAE